MQIFKGKGKIYDNSENYLDEIIYEIHQKSPAESDGKEWWGEITLDKCIILTGNYIIELNDGRRGPCVASMKTHSSFGLAFDSYNLEGTGSLTR
jgi:hypothetical protein